MRLFPPHAVLMPAMPAIPNAIDRLRVIRSDDTGPVFLVCVSRHRPELRRREIPFWDGVSGLATAKRSESVHQLMPDLPKCNGTHRRVQLLKGNCFRPIRSLLRMRSPTCSMSGGAIHYHRGAGI